MAFFQNNIDLFDQDQSMEALLFRGYSVLTSSELAQLTGDMDYIYNEPPCVTDLSKSMHQHHLINKQLQSDLHKNLCDNHPCLTDDDANSGLQCHTYLSDTLSCCEIFSNNLDRAVSHNKYNESVNCDCRSPDKATVQNDIPLMDAITMLCGQDLPVVDCDLFTEHCDVVHNDDVCAAMKKPPSQPTVVTNLDQQEVSEVYSLGSMTSCRSTIEKTNDLLREAMAISNLTFMEPSDSNITTSMIDSSKVSGNPEVGHCSSRFQPQTNEQSCLNYLIAQPRKRKYPAPTVTKMKKTKVHSGQNMVHTQDSKIQQSDSLTNITDNIEMYSKFLQNIMPSVNDSSGPSDEQQTVCGDGCIIQKARPSEQITKICTMPNQHNTYHYLPESYKDRQPTSVKIAPQYAVNDNLSSFCYVTEPMISMTTRPNGYTTPSKSPQVTLRKPRKARKYDLSKFQMNSSSEEILSQLVTQQNMNIAKRKLTLTSMQPDLAENGAKVNNGNLTYRLKTL